MKVLHVESGMHLYGGALQVTFLLRGLRERGIDCALACPEGSAIAQAAAPLARVCTMPMKGDLDLGLTGRLRQLIRAERPDVVHLHSRRGSDIWGAVAAHREGVPVVLSRRVDNPEQPWIARLKYRLYDHVVTISDGIRQVLLAEDVPAEKISCVLSAVDTTQYRPAPEHRAWLQQEFKLPEASLTIGMVAQFIERKGHQTLLDALPEVVAAVPDVQVLLFGQGPLHEAIHTRVQGSPLLRQHMQLPGFRRDLDRILPGLDVLAHPAFMEGLGVSLLQAAACGIPIVAGRAGGIPEIVRPGINGELIEPGDAPALARALIALLRDPGLRARYGQAGRAWVEQTFSIDTMVSGNLAVYHSVLAARASS